MPKKEKFKKLRDEEMLDVKSIGNEGYPVSSTSSYYDGEDHRPPPPGGGYE